jgi:hypothetical protein
MRSGFDPLTGLNWNNGQVIRNDSIGIKITETIGGDDVSDYAKFSLSEVSNIRLNTTGAISLRHGFATPR